MSCSRFTQTKDIFEAISHLADSEVELRSHMLLKLIVNGEQKDLDKHSLRYKYGIPEKMVNHCYLLHEQWEQLKADK